jgi:serine/threonine protein kinase
MKHCPQCSTGYPDSLTTCPTHGLPLNEIRELKPGMVIHHSYRIIRKLGQGGMGTVYLAWHILMKGPRALKFLSVEQSRDQALTSRFLREVQTLRQLHHNNLVYCGDLEPAEDDSLFFPMEFVDGPDLQRFIHDAPKPFDVPLALSITRGIAEGLGAAHAKGMVHRDIKPANILMAREGSAWLPKIADFGIVAIKESRNVLTRTGGTRLTMNYAAPEQWRGTPSADLDGRTDLYALGVVLYEMLTGQTPFSAENYEGWYEQHQHTPPQPPTTLRPDLTNWQGLDALVLHLLAKNREDRPSDVAELIGLIDQCLTKTNVAKERVYQEKEAEEWLKKGLDLWKQGSDETQASTDSVNLFFDKQMASGRVYSSEEKLSIFQKSFGSDPYHRREEAFVCFERGLELSPSHPRLQHSLGVAYNNGWGVPQDLAKGIVWFRKAAEQGYAKAQYDLGWTYIPDYTQAAFWYRKAAKQGQVDSQRALGDLYVCGMGVELDYAQAAFWIRKVAEQAEDNDMRLSDIYSSLTYWLSVAAEQGVIDAQYLLGWIYHHGRHVPQDLAQAIKWYRMAAKQGDTEAIRILKLL